MSTNQSSWPDSGHILRHLWVLNFCRWVVEVPPGETFLAARSKEKRLYSQVTRNWVLDLEQELEDAFLKSTFAPNERTFNYSN